MEVGMAGFHWYNGAAVRRYAPVQLRQAPVSHDQRRLSISITAVVVVEPCCTGGGGDVGGSQEPSQW
ncbi:hypothetical protein SRHO_G00205390 [Serrasalmus rhombeus]